VQNFKRFHTLRHVFSRNIRDRYAGRAQGAINCFDPGAHPAFRVAPGTQGPDRMRPMMRIIFPLLVAFASLLGTGAHAQSNVRLAADAPDSYTVVRGDTLWDISGRFLQEPWR